MTSTNKDVIISSAPIIPVVINSMVEMAVTVSEKQIIDNLKV